MESSTKTFALDQRLVASDVSVAFETHGMVTLKRGGAALSATPSVLRILETFARPMTVIEALPILAAKSKAAFVESTALINELFALGFLRDASATQPAGRFHGEIGMHIAMLNDAARTMAFLSAITRSVRPGDVVVDLGTGTGVLAMAAARAGAARVYAIEASSFADTAEEIIAANGFADVVKVVRGWSTDIELPERADVLVSEIIGNDPFAEGVLHYIGDARRRFLKQGGRLLPDRIALSGYFAAAPESAVAERRVMATDQMRWQADYGFNFAALAGLTQRSTMRLYLPPATTGLWTPCSEAACVWSHRFGDEAAANTTSVLVDLDETPEHPAFVWFIDLGFDAAVLSTDPRLDRTSHWQLPVDLPTPGANRYRIELRTSAIAQRLVASFKSASH